LVVILDSSGSIGSPNYELSKTFVAKLSNAFTPYANTRFSLIDFSTTAAMRINLKSGLTPREIEAEIMKTPYQGGTTETAEGIDMATKELLANARNVPQTFVVLTDGGSNNRNKTVMAARNAIRRGIRTFAVGIGSGVDNTELLQIAGIGNVFTLPTFDQLISVLVPISKALCPTPFKNLLGKWDI